VAVNLSVKNVPDELADLLRRRAAANNRSLQRELISILEAAVGHGTSSRRAATKNQPNGLTIEELVERSRKLFPEGTESSVEFIRKMRESR
jgi:antitoxin FitA